MISGLVYLWTSSFFSPPSSASASASNRSLHRPPQGLSCICLFPIRLFCVQRAGLCFYLFWVWSGHTYSPSNPTAAQALMYLCWFWLWVGVVLGSPSQLSGPSMSILLLSGYLAVAFQRGGEHVFFSDLDNKEKCKTKLSSLVNLIRDLRRRNIARINRKFRANSFQI